MLSAYRGSYVAPKIEPRSAQDKTIALSTVFSDQRYFSVSKEWIKCSLKR